MTARPSPQSPHWHVAPPPPPEAEEALRRFPPILRQVLYQRGFRTYDDARAFLEARPPEGTQDPFAIRDMDVAADRLIAAIRRREPIAVYGDYDVDGVTATALLTQALRRLGADVRPYIPNRFDEGYGLNFGALGTLHEQGVRVVVTVDCGIRSVEEAEHARHLGLDLIISDHHIPGEELPPALAVVNPKRADDAYPEKFLAGVGLAYKIAQALFLRLRPREADTVRAALDLVALGSVADLAPLQGENRYLVREGLHRLRRPQRQGLFSLIQVSGLKPERLTATHIGFMLGPRLNAAGRLDSALAALELLLTDDYMEAGRLAMQLDAQNRERQRQTREVQEKAEAIALADGEVPLLLFAAHPDFNPGVVGLAASRLVERYYRPAIVGQRGAEFTRASCRSIPEFHITHALEACGHLLEHYGGHAAAAGFTVRNDRLPDLLACLHAQAEAALGSLDLRPTLHADAEVRLRDLGVQVLTDFRWLEPTGYGNPRPRFVARGVRVLSARTVGKEAQHLKLILEDGGTRHEAIAFRQGHWLEDMPKTVDIFFTYEWNEYNGQRRPQLNIKDLRAAE